MIGIVTLTSRKCKTGFKDSLRVVNALRDVKQMHVGANDKVKHVLRAASAMDVPISLMKEHTVVTYRVKMVKNKQVKMRKYTV